MLTTALYIQKGRDMTVRVITTTGEFKILECEDVEVDPITNADMTVKGGVLHIRDRRE